MVRMAITRAVSSALQDCELTHRERTSIDVELARRQHAAYEDALRGIGCEVRQLPELPEHPDSVFVEDTAIVLDEIAVITRPGAASRRGETASVAAALSAHRELRHVEAPGMLDGGDVLRVGRTLFVGRSGRTNAEGIDQLARLLAPFDWQVQGLALQGCLHLKSAVSWLGGKRLLGNREWLDPASIPGHEWLDIDPSEPHAANAVVIGNDVVYPASCPRTAERLLAAGLRVHAVDMSEAEKAEGGVTCCSLVFNG